MHRKFIPQWVAAWLQHFRPQTSMISSIFAHITHRLWWILVVVACGWGCRSSSRTSRLELHVYAASSLQEALRSFKRHFEARYPHVRVMLTLAGSQVLRLQIEQGAKADVFISANTQHTRQLLKQGLLQNPRILGFNELVLIVSRDASGTCKTFQDLPKVTRLVVGTAHVPIGFYTRQILERASQHWGKTVVATVRSRIVSKESNVRLVRAKVELGEADAAIVYRTDAITSQKVTMITIPAPFQVKARYEMGILKNTQHPKLTTAWTKMLFSPTGQRIFQRHGFRLP